MNLLETIILKCNLIYRPISCMVVTTCPIRAPDYTQVPLARPGMIAFISPTHTRTEGFALVWGSELTTKAAKLQGD
jgi:hypothetical protein